MKTFFKTLFGDLYNLAFVMFVVAGAASMVHLGLSRDVVYAMPAVLLAGAGGFARR